MLSQNCKTLGLGQRFDQSPQVNSLAPSNFVLSTPSVLHHLKRELNILARAVTMHAGHLSLWSSGEPPQKPRFGGGAPGNRNRPPALLCPSISQMHLTQCHISIAGHGKDSAALKSDRQGFLVSLCSKVSFCL